MLVFKAIAFFWPFLKEMILGEKTIRESLKSHKGRLLLIGVILASFGLNAFTIPKLIKISAAHVELQRKYAAATRDYKDPGAAPPSPPNREQTPYESTKEFFERLREQERQGREQREQLQREQHR